MPWIIAGLDSAVNSARFERYRIQRRDSVRGWLTSVDSSQTASMRTAVTLYSGVSTYPSRCGPVTRFKKTEGSLNVAKSSPALSDLLMRTGNTASP